LATQHPQRQCLKATTGGIEPRTGGIGIGIPVLAVSTIPFCITDFIVEGDKGWWPKYIVRPWNGRPQIQLDGSQILVYPVANHNSIAEELDQLSLHFREKLSAILRIDVLLLDSGVLLVCVGDLDRIGITHKLVEDGFALVIDNRDASKDLADIGLHEFAVDGDFLGEEVEAWAYWLCGCV
jgi:hypothetical protein